MRPVIIISFLHVSELDVYSIYGNMDSVALAAPHCVRLWVEETSLTHPDAHNPPGLNKIPWQGNEQVYWREMNKLTYDNILSKIHRVLERGYGYRLHHMRRYTFAPF